MGRRCYGQNISWNEKHIDINRSIYNYNFILFTIEKTFKSSYLSIKNLYLTKGQELIIIKHFSKDLIKEKGIFLSKLQVIFIEGRGWIEYSLIF